MEKYLPMFLERVNAAIELISDMVAKIQRGSLSIEDTKALERLFHNLKSGAGMMNFPVLMEASRLMECHLAQSIVTGKTPGVKLLECYKTGLSGFAKEIMHGNLGMDFADSLNRELMHDDESVENNDNLG